MHGMQFAVYDTQRENLAIYGRWRHLTPPKLLLLINQTKLTLTDTVTVIFSMRILLIPIKRLYRNNKRNFCGGAVAGFVGGPVFSRFLTFYPFADKNSIVSSYFIVERGFFCGNI